MRKSAKFSPEVVQRAVRMVFEAKDQYPPQWSAIESIAAKIGCTAETLRRWVRQAESATAVCVKDRARPSSSGSRRSSARYANCAAPTRSSSWSSAFFAAQAELDRRFKS